MADGIRVKEFAADPLDARLDTLFDNVESEAPVMSGSSEEGKGFAADLATQVAGGLEDALKETTNAFISLGDDINKSLNSPELDEYARSIGIEPVEFKGVIEKFDDDRYFERTKREGVSGGSLELVRTLSQFLMPFGVASKGIKAAGITNTAVNTGLSTASTAYFALDPAEQNLSNIIQQYPSLQNPVTEFLASDGNDESIDRLKTATSEVLGLGAGAGLAKLFSQGVNAVRARKAMKSQGYDDDIIDALSGNKRAIDENITFGEQVVSGVTKHTDKEFVDGILDGTINAEKLSKQRRPSAKALERAETEIKDTFERAFSDVGVEVDMDKVAKSVGFVDDPIVKDILSVTSEKGGKATISWDETRARALGMTLEEAQQKLGTAGDFTAALERANIQSIADTAKFKEVVTEKGIRSPEAISSLAKAIDSTNLANIGRSESGRALRSLQKKNSVKDVLKSLPDSTLDEIEAIARAGSDDPTELAGFLKQIKNSRVSDLRAGLRYYWMNSVLSGPVTHLTNIAGNLSFLAMRPLERAGAAAIGTLKNSDERALFKEVMEMYIGYGEGFKDAVRTITKAAPVDEELAKRISKGTKLDESVPDIMRGEILMRKSIGASEQRLTLEQFKQLGPLGMGQEFLARALSAPTDFLGETDNFIKMMAARGEKRALAFRESAGQGLVGNELKSNMDRILTNTANSSDEIAKFSKINDAAEYFAKETTFQKDLGQVGSLFVSVREKVPGMEYVIPFVKTPVNILDETFLQRTPLGVLHGSIRDKIIQGGPAADEIIARMSIGTGVMGGIAAAYADGQITGAGPSNRAERERWLETNQPWSIKVGDKWYQYNRIEPIGTLIGLGARFSEILEHNRDIATLSPEDEEDLAFNVVGGMSKYVTDKSLMTGIDNVLSVLEGEEFAVKKLISSAAGGFVPFSGMLRQTAATIDPELREVDTILERVSSGLPGLSDNLPNKRNRFGDKVTRSERTLGMVLPISHTSGGVKDSKTRRINEIEANAGIVIGRPTLFMNGIKLEMEEYDRRMEYFSNFKDNGKTVKDAIIEVASDPEFQALPTTAKAGQGDIIKRIYRTYLKASDASFIQENPEIADRINRAKIDTLTIQRRLGATSGVPTADETKPKVFIGAQ